MLTLLEWRHNEPHGAPIHPRLDCLLSRLFQRRSKKTSMHRVTGLCDGNPPTGDRWISFTKGQQRGNVSIWWRHNIIVSWISGIKIQLNSNRNIRFIHENEFANVVRKIAAILWSSWCFKPPLKLGQGWVIICKWFMGMWFLFLAPWPQCYFM